MESSCRVLGVIKKETGAEERILKKPGALKLLLRNINYWMQKSEYRELRRGGSLKTNGAPHNKQKIPMELVMVVSTVSTWDLTVCQLLPTFAEWQENEQQIIPKRNLVCVSGDFEIIHRKLEGFERIQWF